MKFAKARNGKTQFVRTQLVLAGLALALALATASVNSGCSKQGLPGPSGGNLPTISLPNGSVLPVVTGINVMQMTVNGSTCSASNQYQNKPCVAVTICTPGSTPPSPNCQTITDILLDTGSYGLRLFSQVVTVNLTQVNASTGKPLAECASFGTGSDWGPVMLANVVLAGEPAVQAPIHVMNSTFAGGAPANSCGTPDSSPQDAGFNGILGVGLFGPDCGQTICGDPTSSWYYSCNGNTCTSVAAANSIQVTNPVALLPKDNNGVIIELPTIPLGGAASSAGYVVMGIGTRSNNVPGGVTSFAADPQYGVFGTTYNGELLASFVDTGSNAYYFTDPGIPDCGSPNSAWFCPSSTGVYSASDTSVSGTPSANVQFYVGNTDNLLRSGNLAFMEFAGDTSSSGGGSFDWGLPFYFGRNVYVGIEGTSSSLGSGPYWAF